MSRLSGRGGQGANPIGASNRVEIFSSRDPLQDEKHGSGGENLSRQLSARDQLQDAYGVGDEESDPLQLEHMIGYAGDYRKTVLSIPGRPNLYVKNMGNLVGLEDLSDPYNQRLLRDHDMPVCTLAVSPSGNFIASGQVGTKSFKGYAAPIFIWITDSCRRLRVLKGLTQRVNLISFSTDERFVCAGGEDGLLYVWDLSTAEVVYATRLSSPASVLQWVDHKRLNHYTSYDLVVGCACTLYFATLSFAPDRVQWNMTMNPFATQPGGALVRTFTSLNLSPDLNFCYVGTEGGEIMVYRRDTKVFRACIPVCTKGVRSIATLPNGDLVCGGGDGTIKVLSGYDMGWRMLKECTLDIKGVVSLSLIHSNDATELLVGCASGNVYRCDPFSLGNAIISTGLTSSVTCSAFEKLPYTGAGISARGSSSTKFVTGTKSGEISLWDLSDYACLATSKFPKTGSVLALTFADDNKSVISGWDDGFIRCVDAETLSHLLWYLPNAHRGGTHSLCVHQDNNLSYFVSGGGDGAVRVWRLSNRELVTQYTEHTKCVVRVAVDVKSPQIIHSVSSDCSILSYDLRSARRIICHLVTSGSMSDLSQRKDGENELITCDSQGRLLHWDIDVRDPVLAMQDPSKSPLRCLAVSPSGRFLAFAGDDFILKVLHIQSGQVESLGQGHSNSITLCMWSPDELQIVTGGEDSCICVWNFYLGGDKSAAPASSSALPLGGNARK